MYLESDGKAITDKSIYGHFAAGVPGTVDGMIKAHARYGKLSWKAAIQPSIELAKKGFPITAKQATELNKNKALSSVALTARRQVRRKQI